MNVYDYTPPTPGTIGKLKYGRRKWIVAALSMKWPKDYDTMYVIVISAAGGSVFEVPYVRLYSVFNSKMILLPYGDYTCFVDTL